MSVSFCADCPSGQNELLIGTAPTVQCFVMIECPPPWGKTIDQAKYLPDTLRTMIADPQYARRGIRFYLIKGDSTTDRRRPRLVIFQRPQGFTAGYRAYELRLHDLNEAAVQLAQYFASRSLPPKAEQLSTRDIFICTHGQYDACCSRYGYPFYRQAQQYLQTHLQNDRPNNRQAPAAPVRLWQISHIGGHRFAPTLLTLPDGRYYGRLTLETFRLLLQSHVQRPDQLSEELPGQWRSLLATYRGWSLLPGPLQILEHSFWRNQGWFWLDQQIRYQILQGGTNQAQWQVLFAYRSPSGGRQSWWATVVEDAHQTVMASCGDTAPTQIAKFRIAALRSLSPNVSLGKQGLGVR
ncbi:MAG: sucrase ferredoxin [Cyanobacteria bacterium P01_A01_bin.114]